MVRLPHQVGSIPNPTHQSCYHVWLAASEETIPNCIIPKWTLSLYQVQQRRPFQTQLTNHVTMFGLPVCGNNTQLYHSQVDICHQMTILHCRSPSFNISTPTLCFEYHFPLDHHGSCVALPSCLRRAHHLLFQSLKIAYINVYSSCVYHVFTPFV